MSLFFLLFFFAPYETLESRAVPFAVTEVKRTGGRLLTLLTGMSSFVSKSQSVFVEDGLTLM